MTRLERVCGVMGFKLIPNAYEFNGMGHWGYVDKNGALVCAKEFNPQNDLFHAKLLQQRMVDDGWNIAFMITPTGINASAWKETQYMTDVVTTEPLAIFELFCRVYGIPASE